ncbi:MAG: sulfatase, partial [Armatimonadota bacterium]
MQTVGAATVAGSAMAQSRGGGKGRPNFLFIMTDQQYAEAMSCRMGRELIHTPAMDSIAESGMLFERAYCANPLCVPSRAALFTGRFTSETGVQTNSGPKLDPAEFPCIGTIFGQAGYDTGWVGKWHLPFATREGAGHGFRYMKPGGKGDDDESAELGAEFIREKRDRPFLLSVSLRNPHDICQWARGQELPVGPIGDPPAPETCPPLKATHLPPENETDIIAFMRKSYHNSKTFPVGDFDDGKWRQYIWAYYRLIEMVDGEIAKVLAALRESGQEEDTLIVFTSDHGDCHGAHRWNQKTVLYDESALVPFILSQKGVTKSGTSDKLVQTGVDLIPTLCQYAGMDVPEGLKGVGLAEIANGGDVADWREYVVVCNKLAQGAPVDGVSREPDGRMVRSDRYKYCLYNDGERRESLVDMVKDPGEMVNQAPNPEFRPILEQHRAYRQ